MMKQKWINKQKLNRGQHETNRNKKLKNIYSILSVRIQGTGYTDIAISSTIWYCCAGTHNKCWRCCCCYWRWWWWWWHKGHTLTTPVLLGDLTDERGPIQSERSASLNTATTLRLTLLLNLWINQQWTCSRREWRGTETERGNNNNDNQKREKTKCKSNRNRNTQLSVLYLSCSVPYCVPNFDIYSH